MIVYRVCPPIETLIKVSSQLCSDISTVLPLTSDFYTINNTLALVDNCQAQSPKVIYQARKSDKLKCLQPIIPIKLILQSVPK